MRGYIPALAANSETPRRRLAGHAAGSRHSAQRVAAGCEGLAVEPPGEAHAVVAALPRDGGAPERPRASNRSGGEEPATAPLATRDDGPSGLSEKPTQRSVGQSACHDFGHVAAVKSSETVRADGVLDH
jgi:hypothetical protein